MQGNLAEAAPTIRGVPMLGICNGFQVLTQIGLLPGPSGSGDQIEWPDTPAPPTVALCDNAAGRYADCFNGSTRNIAGARVADVH